MATRHAAYSMLKMRVDRNGFGEDGLFYGTNSAVYSLEYVFDGCDTVYSTTLRMARESSRADALRWARIKLENRHGFPVCLWRN